jgi:hypothetical protein
MDPNPLPTDSTESRPAPLPTKVSIVVVPPTRGEPGWVMAIAGDRRPTRRAVCGAHRPRP